MQYNINIHKSGVVYDYTLDKPVNLYTFLKENNFKINSSCGGNGTCGKCIVKVDLADKSQADIPTLDEKKLLGDERLEDGYRLACYMVVKSDIEVFVDDAEQDLKIASHAKRSALELDPIVKKTAISLSKPSIEDQRPDLQRIEDEGYDTDFCGPEVLHQLSDVMRAQDFNVTLVNIADKLTLVESGDTTSTNYGVAFDIGTTTVVGYLMDLNTGEKLVVDSIANPQRMFGADVISRINYSSEGPYQLQKINDTIIEGINEIIGNLTKTIDIKNEDIYTAVFAGNTTMMHFLLGLPAYNIAVAPFVPVTTKMHIFPSPAAGIEINKHGKVVFLPCVASYIGADTVAAVLASRMHLDDELTLLVDIGTNGEIVLGNKDGMYSCSTAAGPAFEGALIRNGVSGISGAIDTVRLVPQFEYTTIENKAPLGICGSGLVDVVAEMLRAGVLEESGRLKDESSVPDYLKARVIEIDGQRAFALADKTETKSNFEIAITQKDIREMQNAKAAIAAGISILADSIGKEFSEIQKVYLAGGFGSYIDISSALEIGLFPEELEGKIESIGNAAGLGTAESMLSHQMLKQTDLIKSNIKYVELSSRTDFIQKFVENMTF